MEKKRFDQYQNDSLGSLEGLNKNTDKEVLEISSTGYGFRIYFTQEMQKKINLRNKKMNSL